MPRVTGRSISQAKTSCYGVPKTITISKIGKMHQFDSFFNLDKFTAAIKSDDET
jgi:hypothetical protein